MRNPQERRIRRRIRRLEGRLAWNRTLRTAWEKWREDKHGSVRVFIRELRLDDPDASDEELAEALVEKLDELLDFNGIAEMISDIGIRAFAALAVVVYRRTPAWLDARARQFEQRIAELKAKLAAKSGAESGLEALEVDEGPFAALGFEPELLHGDDATTGPKIDYYGLYTALQKATAPMGESLEAVRGEEEDGLADGLSRLATEQARQSVDGDPDVLVAIDHPVAALVQSFLQEQRDAVSPLEGVQFDSQNVLGWARSFFTWRRGKGRHPWIEQAGPPTRIPNGARIAMLGDWGTGLYGAPVCARTIAAATPVYDVVLHLGDVYYSGTAQETRERFLGVWPKVPGAINRACNSNHEMYAGGFGYFEQTLPQFEQKASHFCLENDHYRLIGLDTGYTDGDLMGAQAQWAAQLVASAGTRKILLCSHHQPYSLFEGGYRKLVAALSPLLAKRCVLGWWWGHEHRCVLFNPHPIWGLHGRCIGHSGFPYFRDKFAAPPEVKNSDGSTWQFMARDSIAGLVLDGPNPYITKKPQAYGPNGFASLELKPDRIVEVIASADGTELRRSELS